MSVIKYTQPSPLPVGHGRWLSQLSACQTRSACHLSPRTWVRFPHPHKSQMHDAYDLSSGDTDKWVPRAYLPDSLADLVSSRTVRVCSSKHKVNNVWETTAKTEPRLACTHAVPCSTALPCPPKKFYGLLIKRNLRLIRFENMYYYCNSYTPMYKPYKIFHHF